MAFNFNWSPLIADTSRAREMLTAALNKSPKPPIIVDDIIVTELNLGSTPPELEILEIGDLADDRFRGIFKMSYTGDAFLTLKTRVQANPLNTYLSTKPSFSSPQPLAASSSLTIPLQITLSDIRLSGFVILVFSRQKGLTIVFRNDPLESLKVSSTFDSIPFIRDYLQKEIERQLRILFMEDLPAILHRLSLRLCSPDYQELQEEANREHNTEKAAPVDPLASPPQDPVDAFGNPIDERDLAFSLEGPSEIHASFSAKNLLRLAALTDSQRTLSLFTPSLRDTVYRAWAGAAERADNSGVNTPLTLSSLSRVHSTASLSTGNSQASSVTDGSDTGTHSSRPSLHSTQSGFSSLGLGLGAGRPRTTQTRKRKKRVINLRKDRSTENETSSVTTETSTPPPTIAISDACSVIPEEQIEDLETPPRSPQKVHFRRSQDNLAAEPATAPRLHERASNESLARSASPALSQSELPQRPRTPRTFAQQPHEKIAARSSKAVPPPIATSQPMLHHPTPSISSAPSSLPLLRSYSLDKLAMHQPATPAPGPLAGTASPPHLHSHSYYPYANPHPTYSHPHPMHPGSPTPFDALTMGSSGGILEQAWMMKMAREIARRVREETRVTEGKAEEARREGMNDGAGPATNPVRDVKMPAPEKSAGPAAGFWERAQELMGEAPPAYAA